MRRMTILALFFVIPLFGCAGREGFGGLAIKLWDPMSGAMIDLEPNNRVTTSTHVMVFKVDYTQYGIAEHYDVMLGEESIGYVTPDGCFKLDQGYLYIVGRWPWVVTRRGKAVVRSSKMVVRDYASAPGGVDQYFFREGRVAHIEVVTTNAPPAWSPHEWFTLDEFKEVGGPPAYTLWTKCLSAANPPCPFDSAAKTWLDNVETKAHTAALLP